MHQGRSNRSLANKARRRRRLDKHRATGAPSPKRSSEPRARFRVRETTARRRASRPTRRRKRGFPSEARTKGGSAARRRGAKVRLRFQPRPGQMGVGSQLQQMMAGAIQGGFNNPNASRLNTGALSFDTAAWDLGPYARKVQERVQSNWRTPEAEMTLRQKGWVVIHFNIQKDGRVTDLEVVRPSGIPSYDQSAMDALRSSNPLPPLPDVVTVPQLGALFRFYYNMRLRIDDAKAKGLDTELGFNGVLVHNSSEFKGRVRSKPFNDRGLPVMPQISRIFQAALVAVAGVFFPVGERPLSNRRLVSALLLIVVLFVTLGLRPGWQGTLLAFCVGTLAFLTGGTFAISENRVTFACMWHGDLARFDDAEESRESMERML